MSKDAVKLELPNEPKKALPITKVRFCWADSPMCNLYSTEGLPAVPFEMAITAPAKRVAGMPKVLA